MEYKTITAVGIDVSKGKSTIAVRRPGGEVVLVPFQVNHDAAGLSGLVKTLRENFTEKKAMSALYKLEKLTVELIKVNSEIVALAQKFDGQWSQKYQ